MEISLKHSAKQDLLDTLKHFIPVSIEKFVGSVEISLKRGDVGVVKYIGHIHIKNKT
jgi:hypothetical protein